jgi:hypothetical protein
MFAGDGFEHGELGLGRIYGKSVRVGRVIRLGMRES